MDRLPWPGVLLGSMAGKFQNEDLVPVRASPLAWPRPEEREHLHPLWALLASRHITEGRLVSVLPVVTERAGVLLAFNER